MKKRVLAFIVAVILCLRVMPVHAVDTNIQKTTSGSCGEQLVWELTEDGILTISGEGKMEEYAGSSSVPWFKSKDTIAEVVIKEGVGSVGRYAFYGCGELISIILPDSISEIGEYAFYNCQKLGNIEIPNLVRSIGDEAFAKCAILEAVYFCGDIPIFGENSFYNSTNVTAYYPANNLTWTDENMLNYGGTITWVATEYRIGDLNSDGNIDICDLIRLKKVLQGLDESDGASPDIDNNGRIDDVDIVCLRKMLLGIICTSNGEWKDDNVDPDGWT